MCKYCHFEENGDFPEDYEYIVEVGNVPITMQAKIDTDLLSGKLNVKQELEVMVGVDQHNNLFAYLFNSNATCDDEEIDMTFNEKINYCPMCGRKLEPVRDET